MKLGFRIFSGIFFSGLIGYFTVGSSWLRYIFAHLGALAIIGLVAWWGGKMAQKKGYGFKMAFWWVFLLPIVLGIIGVLMVTVFGGGGCGGVISLFTMIVMVVIYKFMLPDKRDSAEGL